MPDSMETMVGRIDERTEGMLARMDKIEKHLETQNGRLRKVEDKQSVWPWKWLVFSSFGGGSVSVGGIELIKKLFGG